MNRRRGRLRNGRRRDLLRRRRQRANRDVERGEIFVLLLEPCRRIAAVVAGFVHRLSPAGLFGAKIAKDADRVGGLYGAAIGHIGASEISGRRSSAPPPGSLSTEPLVKRVVIRPTISPAEMDSDRVRAEEFATSST